VGDVAGKVAGGVAVAGLTHFALDGMGNPFSHENEEDEDEEDGEEDVADLE